MTCSFDFLAQRHTFACQACLAAVRIGPQVLSCWQAASVCPCPSVLFVTDAVAEAHVGLLAAVSRVACHHKPVSCSVCQLSTNSELIDRVWNNRAMDRLKLYHSQSELSLELQF